jgi:hypothetical protein
MRKDRDRGPYVSCDCQADAWSEKSYDLRWPVHLATAVCLQGFSPEAVSF